MQKQAIARLAGQEKHVTDEAQRDLNRYADPTDAATNGSEAFFRQVMEQSALACVMLDAEGRIVFCNEFLLALSGHTRTAIQGEDWFDLFVPEHDRHAARQAFGELMRHRVAVVSAPTESAILTADGRCRPLSWNDVRIDTANGFRLVRMGTEVSPRQGLAEGQIKALLAHAPMVIYFKDLDGRYLHASPLFGIVRNRPVETILGSTVYDLLPREEADRHTAEDHEVFSQGVVRRYDCSIIDADGQTHYLSMTKIPVHDSEGRIVGLVGVCSDVTSLHEAQETARELQGELIYMSRATELGAMAASLAHELNQPLTAVNNYASATINQLIKGEKTPAVLVPALLNIREQSMRAAEILRRIRRFLRKAEPQSVTIDLNVAVHDSLELLRGEARRAGVMIDLSMAENLPPVWGDTVHVQQVVFNLARNAIEAMEDVPEEQRRLIVRTRADSEAVRVEIMDSGPGIAEEVRRRLFEPFVTTKPQGIGVGLSICRTIVESHGGNLALEPGESGGTRAMFTLPTAAGAG